MNVHIFSDITLIEIFFNDSQFFMKFLEYDSSNIIFNLKYHLSKIILQKKIYFIEIYVIKGKVVQDNEA